MPADPRELLHGRVTIASLPAVFVRLNEAIDNPRSSVAEISEVIQADPGLAARLQRLVNSAFYSFPARIETVSRAITVVGTLQLRDLALATSVLQLFPRLPDDLITMETFWAHSIGCGVAARVLASYRREPNPERHLVAGLLHDVGALLLYTQRPELARHAIERARRARAPLAEVERELFGFSHASAGAALLEAWGLPAGLKEAVAFHHTPSRAPSSPVDAAVVHVADLLANALELGHSGDPRVPPLDPRAWAALELPPSVLAPVLDQIDRQFADARRLILPEAA